MSRIRHFLARSRRRGRLRSGRHNAHAKLSPLSPGDAAETLDDERAFKSGDRKKEGDRCGRDAALSPLNETMIDGP